MAKKVSTQDLFDADFLNEPIRKTEQFLALIKEVEINTAKTLKSQQKLLKDFQKIGGLKEYRDTTKAIKDINLASEKLLELKQKELKLTAELNAAKSEQAKKNETLRNAINEQNKATREQIKNEQALTKILNTEVKSIQQLQERNNALIRTRKNLDLTTKQGIADYKRLTTEIKANNAQLQKHDAAVGSYVRNVGNYSSAIKGFGTQLLGILGAGTFIGVVQNGIKVTAEFEQSLADLKAITGATDEQMKFFRDTALNQTLSLEGSTASAKDYTEALKLIASAKPELLENAAALNQVTQNALLLADASGMELPESATKLTDAMNQFGASADMAGKFVDVLAAGAKYGSAEIPQITDALLEFGPVAKSYNVSIQESTAAIEGLAEKGIKGSEAGTKLRNVLLALGAAKGLDKAALDSFERLGIDTDILSDKSLTLEERLTELSKAQNDEVAMLKIFGKENISAAKTVLSQKDRIAELTKKVDENGVAQEQAAIRTNTLAGEWKKLGNAWQSEMIKMGQSGGDLKDLVEFVRKNLGTIIATITKLTKMFLVFKAAGAGMKLFSAGTDLATTSFKNLNTAMKANVVGLVAVAVYELLDAFGAFESEADRIEKRLNKQRQQSVVYESYLNAKNVKEKAELKKKIDELELAGQREIDLAEAGGEKTIEIQKKTNEQKLAELSNFRDKSTMDYLLQQKQLDEIDTRLFEERKKEKAYRDASNTNQQAAHLLKQQEAVVDQLSAERMALNNSTKQILTDRKEAVVQIEEISHQMTVTNKAEATEQTKDVAVATDEQKAKWKALAEERKRIALDLKRYLEDLQAENIEYDRDKEIEQERLRTEREIEAVNEKYEKLGKLSVDQKAQQDLILENLEIAHQERLKEITKKYDQTELDDALANLDFKYKLREEYLARTVENEEEYNAKLKQLNIDQLRDEIDILEGNLADEKVINDKKIELDNLLRDQKLDNAAKVKKANEDAADAIKAGLKGIDDELEKQDARNKDLISATQTLADELTKIWSDASKRREEAIDREIEYSKSRQDQLKSIAERGVLEASQSLAAEERKQAELERRKIEEQKRQQRLELANTAFKAYVGHVDNKDTSPLTSTIRDITALTAFIHNLPAFIEGTEHVGDALGKPHLNTKQDGYLVRVDGEERIVDPENNAKLAGIPNDELGRIVQESMVAKQHSSYAVNEVKMAGAYANMTSWADNSQVIHLMGQVAKGIKELPDKMPVPYLGVDEVTQKIVQGVKQGSKALMNHFSKPNINNV